MTTPPGYVGNQTDTEGVSGNTGAASRGTQDRASVTDTANSGAGGGGSNVQTGGAVGGTTDTTGTNSSNTTPWTPSTNYLTDTVETGNVGWPTTTGVTQAYRAPTQGIGYLGAAGAADTTWTDRPISDGSVRSDYVQNMTGTLESALIGSTGPTSALVPVAPSGTPTATAGARQVTVTWAAVADPDATAPVTGYVILGSTGGTTFVGRGVTSAVVTNLVPDTGYTFRVAARNKNGVGPYGTASASAQAYNPDEPDVNKPGGLDPYSAQNPIYGPDGTIKSGSGLQGRPNAPTGVVLSGDGTVGDVVGTWVAPTTGGRVSSYTLTLSSGQTKTVSSTTLSTTITGVASATAITGTVTANGAVANATSSASASFGKPTAPNAPTVSSPAAGQVKVDWTAPSSGAPINYIVTLGGQDTTTHTVAGNTLTYTFTGLTTGHVDTATVGAQGSVSTTTSAASGNVTVS